MDKTVEAKITEIEQFAHENGDKASLFFIWDMLEDKSDRIDKKVFEDVIGRLKADGFEILTEEPAEDYNLETAAGSDFVPADISISLKPITVYSVVERLENQEIDLQPGYQRKQDLWSDAQQSRLIESLMLKIPLPAFYFSALHGEEWSVIDGLQRLTAFRNYLLQEGQKTFVGMQYLKDFNGKTFDSLPRQYQRRIRETTLMVYVVEKSTPDEVVYNIFQRINTGGLILTPQEIRQALFHGKASNLAGELAESDIFRKATDYSIPSLRMEDRELVLRFIAYTEMDVEQKYTGNLDNFLIRTMRHVNTYEAEELDIVRQRFYRVMNACYDIFGKNSFRKIVRDQKRRTPVNKAVFEMWAVCMGELPQEELDILIRKKDAVKEAFAEKLLDDKFQNYLRASDAPSVRQRIKIGRELLRGIYAE